jgi:hypothetical protein
LISMYSGSTTGARASRHLPASSPLTILGPMADSARATATRLPRKVYR